MSFILSGLASVPVIFEAMSCVEKNDGQNISSVGHIHKDRSIRPRRPACVVQAEARGTRLVGSAARAPPAAPSGASEEAPDFTASVSHGREQMVGGIGG